MFPHITTLAAITIAGTVITAAPAGARPTSDDGGSSDQATTASTYASPYSEPLDALGGRTQAQYLADHMVGDYGLSSAT